MGNKEALKLGMEQSAIRKLHEYGKMKSLEVGSDKIFDFSIGNPSVPAPKIVTKTLINLLETVNPAILHGYTSAAGDIFVRDAIAKNLNETYDVCESGKYIFLTVGAAASLTISINALTEENDEVIVFSPFFPEYRVFVEHAKATLVVARSNEETFQPDFLDFEQKITSKTKIVIINSPNNPTGVLYSKESIEKLSEILRKKEKEYNHPIYLLTDEPYRELIYSKNKYPFVTKYYDNTLVSYSYSKSLSLPGERIGYVLVGSGVHDKDKVYYAICGAARSLGFVCAPALFQYLIPHVVGMTSDLEIYKNNLEILYENLTKIGYRVVYPEGAFYLFVEALESDACKFSEKAKEFGLLLVPSDSFGISGYVRISYCVDPCKIKESITQFAKLFASYKEK